MALVMYRGSCDFMIDIIKKIDLKGCYQHLTYSTLSCQRTTSGRTLNWQSLRLKCYTLPDPQEKTHFNEVVRYLATELNLPLSLVLSEYKKCPRRNLFKLEDVKSTLTFLKKSGFETNVIAESVSICFYHSGYIKRGFQEIAKNKVELSKRGLSEGHTEDMTDKFEKGTVSRDKRLQLCLYYMELPFDFNGFGCFVKE